MSPHIKFGGDNIKVCIIGEIAGVEEVWLNSNVPDEFDEVMMARVGGRGCGVGFVFDGL